MYFELKCSSSSVYRNGERKCFRKAYIIGIINCVFVLLFSLKIHELFELEFYFNIFTKRQAKVNKLYSCGWYILKNDANFKRKLLLTTKEHNFLIIINGMRATVPQDF